MGVNMTGAAWDPNCAERYLKELSPGVFGSLCNRLKGRMIYLWLFIYLFLLF